MKLNFEENIILENEAVKLEALEWNHLEPLALIVKDNPDILKYSPSKFGTKELLKEYIKNDLELRNNKQKYPFVIFDKTHKVYVGSTSFMNISEENQRLEIGSTWLGKKYQRTGINRNCKYLLLTYVFETLNMKRIELKTDARNIQSQKAIEDIGGKFEGRLRSHMLMSDGYRRDTVYYSILANEWTAIKNTVFNTIK